MPRVSVIMPVWNGSLYIREAIESVLAQTQSDFELIIVDDGSVDNTVAIIKSYADTRIILVQQDHEGIVVALNQGVAMARADWIARMDADDIAMPQRFELQLKALAANPKAVLCHTNFDFLDSNGSTRKNPYFPLSEAMLMLQLCFFCPIAHPTVIYKKDMFFASGGYLPEERHAEDYGLWGRLLQKGSVIGLPQALLRLRRHDQGISVTAGELQQRVAGKIALQHCAVFMGLDGVEASRAVAILSKHNYQTSIRDWFWFLTRCLPRLKKKDAVLWRWCIRRAIISLIPDISSVRASPPC